MFHVFRLNDRYLVAVHSELISSSGDDKMMGEIVQILQKKEPVRLAGEVHAEYLRTLHTTPTVHDADCAVGDARIMKQCYPGRKGESSFIKRHNSQGKGEASNG